MNIPILILAAGESKRLGQPKQLVAYNNQTLIEHTVKECIASEVGVVHVVCGSYYDKISEKIERLNCIIHRNVNWTQGLGNSIAYGISQLQMTTNDGVILVLGDQPHFAGKLLRKIMEKVIVENSLIINSKYGDESKGPPVYFDSSLFSELELLRGDDGAKSIVGKHQNNADYIDFLGGEFDIDIPEDLEELIRLKLD